MILFPTTNGFDWMSPLALKVAFEQMKRDFPRMTLHEVPDCGHAVPMEQPGLLAEILLDAVPSASNEDHPAQAIPAE